MKLAGFGAIVVAFPILAWQLYRFVAPGLYRNEKGAFLPFCWRPAAVPSGRGAGLFRHAAVRHVVLAEPADHRGGVSAALLPKVSDYLNLVTALLLAFGLCFQLPVVMTLLGLAGIISSKMMAEGRRYAIMAVVVVAAVVTPPDPIRARSCSPCRWCCSTKSRSGACG